VHEPLLKDQEKRGGKRKKRDPTRTKWGNTRHMKGRYAVPAPEKGRSPKGKGRGKKLDPKNRS